MYFAAIHTTPGHGQRDTLKELRRRAHASRRATRRWLRRLGHRTHLNRPPAPGRKGSRALAVMSK